MNGDSGTYKETGQKESRIEGSIEFIPAEKELMAERDIPTLETMNHLFLGSLEYTIITMSIIIREPIMLRTSTVFP